ncbi:MAG: YfhO family protein, partial [Anaerolineae bacterium]
GDLAELRRLQADRLPAEAVERFVRAAKWNEVIAPNLALVRRLPALDGYDGGVLPTADYNRLLSLFIPEESRLPDGRLREQLRAIPPDRLLDLAGVRFVITDKQRDLWSNDVYYDLEQPVLLRPGQTLTLDLAAYPAFAATAIGVVAAPAATDVVSARGVIGVTAADGRRAELELIAPAAGDPPRPVVLALPAAMIPSTLTLAAAADVPTGLIVRGLSLLDTRTAAHQSVTLSPRGDLRRIHSGDVKIYDRTATPGRAWLVHTVIGEPDPAATLAGLADPHFDPRRVAFVDADLSLSGPMAALSGEAVRVISYEAERVHLEADVQEPALLVLADSFYPGWKATVDGAAAPLLRANLMFRGVALAPGRHEIIFSYAPQSWRWGSAISLATCLMLGVILLVCERSRLQWNRN